MSLDSNPETLAALWHSLSEPVRAAIMTSPLGFLLALRKSDRPYGKRALDFLAGAVTGLITGFILHLAGFEPWAIWSANMGIAFLGVDKVRDIVDFLADKYIYKKDPAQ